MTDRFYNTYEWRRLRSKVRKIWTANHWPCAYCEKDFLPEEQMLVDHIQNRREAPHLALELSNLQCVHHRCNTAKYHEREKDGGSGGHGVDGQPVDGW